MLDFTKNLETHLTDVYSLIENLTVDDIKYLDFMDTIVLKNKTNLSPISYSFTFKNLTATYETVQYTIHLSYDLKNSLLRHKFSALRWEFLEQQKLLNDEMLIDSILKLCHTGK